jgi:hypothetical protein
VESCFGSSKSLLTEEEEGYFKSEEPYAIALLGEQGLPSGTGHVIAARIGIRQVTAIVDNAI